MKPGSSSWDNFLETGKIDDYLAYCQQRKEQMLADWQHTTGGALPTDAADHHWNRPAGLQDTRG